MKTKTPEIKIPSEFKCDCVIWSLRGMKGEEGMVVKQTTKRTWAVNASGKIHVFKGKVQKDVDLYEWNAGFKRSVYLNTNISGLNYLLEIQKITQRYFDAVDGINKFINDHDHMAVTEERALKMEAAFKALQS